MLFILEHSCNNNSTDKMQHMSPAPCQVDKTLIQDWQEGFSSTESRLFQFWKVFKILQKHGWNIYA